MLLYMSGVSGKNSLGKIVPLPYGVSTYCKVYFKPHSFGMFLKLGLLMGKRLSFYLFPPVTPPPRRLFIDPKTGVQESTENTSLHNLAFENF